MRVPKVQVVQALSVNLMDTTEWKLMSEEQYNAMVDNELGKVIADLKLGHFLGIREKLELHAALLEHLGELHRVWEIKQALIEAKLDAESLF